MAKLTQAGTDGRREGEERREREEEREGERGKKPAVTRERERRVRGRNEG